MPNNPYALDFSGAAEGAAALGAGIGTYQKNKRIGSYMQLLQGSDAASRPAIMQKMMSTGDPAALSVLQALGVNHQLTPHFQKIYNPETGVNEVTIFDPYSGSMSLMGEAYKREFAPKAVALADENSPTGSMVNMINGRGEATPVGPAPAPKGNKPYVPVTREIFDPGSGKTYIHQWDPEAGNWDTRIGEASPKRSGGQESGFSDDELSKIAKSFGNGQLTPSSLSKRGGQLNKILSKFVDIYPEGSIPKAEANFKYMTNPGNLKSLGLAKAADSRVRALWPKFQAMNNLDGPQFLNGMINATRKQFGDPKITDYESARNAIVMEVNTALSGSSQQTDARINLELENLKSASSPAQAKVAISNLHDALMAREEASVGLPYSWSEVRGEKPSAQQAPKGPISAGDYLKNLGGR